MQPSRGIYLGIFLTSVGVLMLEIILTRIFSFTIWYHLAYLTISTVLLSFGAAGSLLAAYPTLLKKPARLSAISAGAAAISIVIAIYYLASRPIDPVTMFDTPIPFFLGLAKYYIALAIPFIFAGIAIAAPLAAYSKQVNLLYGADLAGAALGCGLAVGALTVTNGGAAIFIASGMLTLGGMFYARRSRLGATLAALSLILFSLAPFGERIIDFTTVPSKGLGMGQARDDYEHIYTQWSPVNRVDVSWNTESFRGGFWSLGMHAIHPGPYPRVMNIRYDGHNGSNIYEAIGPQGMSFLDKHILRVPYLFVEQPDVLVIGLGGGIDVLNGLRRGSQKVTAAELQPITLDVLQNQLVDWTGNVFNDPRVHLNASEGRHFVRSNDTTYDLIQITAVDTFSAQAAGAYVLAESYLYTVEAVEDYFDKLNDGGVLCIVVGDVQYPDPELPSPLGTRILLTMQQALWNKGIENPSDHILLASNDQIMGGWRSAIVMKKSPFTPEELEKARFFASKTNLIYRVDPEVPGHAAMTNLVNESEDSLSAALKAQEFHLAPSTDDAPFFYHILRWSSVLKSDPTVWYFPGSATGQTMLLMMLAQALIFGTLLVLLPLWKARDSLRSSNALQYLLYFLGLGVGFMLIEISFVQKYVLVLGYPTLSLSVTIVSLLVFAALGAALSQLGWKNPRKMLIGMLMATAGLVVVENLILPGIRDNLLGTPLIIRILVTILFQFPLGVCLGMYFPTGIMLLSQSSPRLIPWAWAVNGVGSVMSTVLAVLLAMSFGFSTVSYIAVALYLIGTLSLVRVIGKNGASASA